MERPILSHAVQRSNERAENLYFCDSCGRFSRRPFDANSVLMCRVVMQNDREALTELIGRIERRLERYILNCMRQYNVWMLTEAELCCDALVKLINAAPRFDCTRPIWPWISAIALNVVRDAKKKTHRERTVRLTQDRENPYEPVARPSDQPDYALMQQDFDDKVARAMAELSMDEQRVIELWVAGKKYKEIASELKKPLGTVSRMISQSRTVLRYKLR